jgi:putative ABC transport system permease protein
VIEQAIIEARSILRTSHNLKSNDTDDFKIKDMGTTVSSAVDSAKTMSFLMGSVAIIILIVGGIGIMNIMYISIEERTREIGIRKALGAKYNHILYQFVLEAGILSIFGSLIGILIAIIVYVILDRMNYTAVPVLWGFVLAFSSSLIIGLFFGYYPTKKAAKMKPIDALKYE